VGRNKVPSTLPNPLVRPYREGIISHQSDSKHPKEPQVTAVEVTVEEVNWVFASWAFGVFFSTDEEKVELQRLLSSSSDENEIGNGGIT
jgi:hypothetical protein